MHEQPASQDEGEPSLSQAQDKTAGLVPHIRRIIEGLMIGVAAGVVLGLIGWLSNAQLDDHRRQEQIDHMRGLVMKWGDEFYKPPVPHPIASPERIRALLFKEMEAHLRNALERRSTHVPYDRLYKIERAFSDIKKFERYGPTTKEGISCVGMETSKVNIRIYEDAYRKLEEALDLPEPTRQDVPGQLSDDTGAHGVKCKMPDPVQVIVVEQR